MAQEEQNLKNHQLLEICGVQIIKKIQRKKTLEKLKSGRVTQTNESKSESEDKHE